MDEAITVRRVGCALLVRDPDADQEAADLAAALPGGDGSTPVVVGRSAAAALGRLDPWVVADLDDLVDGPLRLLGTDLGAVGPGGAVPPARLLADRLGVEVTAPDGGLRVLPGGAVFAQGWVSYRPGGGHARGGPRYPEPWWQPHLPAHLGAGWANIPLGLWLRRPDAPERPDDPVHDCPPDAQRLTVVLGHPDEPAPGAATAAAFLAALPGDVRAATVVIDHGRTDLPRRLAASLRAPIRVRHGLPGDEPGLRPFAVESVHHPDGLAEVTAWTAPAPLPEGDAPGAYRLTDGWLVEVTARGLLVRPETLSPDRAWTIPTGATTDLVIAADAEVPAEVGSAVDALIAALPPDAKAALRVVPASQAAEAAARRLAVAPDRIAPRPAPAVPARRVPRCPEIAVTADGRLFPARPATAPGGRRSDVDAPAVVRLPVRAAGRVAPAPRTTVDDDERTVSIGHPNAPAGSARTQAPAKPATALPTALASTVSPPQTAPPPAARPTAVHATAQTAPPPPSESAAAVRAALVRVAVAPPSVVPPPATAPPTPAAHLKIPADARTTAADRRHVRAQLGRRYDAATRVVTALLAERPGLRGAGGDQAALVAELAVARVFATEPDGDYDLAFHVCLAAGLRRLPTLRGVVARRLPAVRCRAGDVLRVPVPVVADAVAPEGPVALIWTTSARRVEGLADDGSGGLAVLPAHSRLRVLAVEPGLLLAADHAIPAEVAAERLRHAAACRADACQEDGAAQVPPWFEVE